MRMKSASSLVGMGLPRRYAATRLEVRPIRSQVSGIDRVFESLAGREFRLAAGRDLNGFASLRIAAFAGRAGRDGECAEADETDIVIVLQGRGDRGESSVGRFLGVGFAEAGEFGDAADEFGLVHRRHFLGI